MKNPSEILSKGFYRDSYRIQTCNLLIRSQMLYSVELRSREYYSDFAVIFFSLMRAFLPVRPLR